MEDEYPNNQNDQIQFHQEAEISGLTISQIAISQMKATAPWMKFLSILGFVVCALLIIFAFAMLFGIGSFTQRTSTGVGIALFVIYCIMAIIVYFPNLYLFNTANSIREFCISNESTSLEKALIMQRKYWGYMGVLAIIYIAFLIIALLFGSLHSIISVG
jgi:hypothetical protein